MSGRQDVQSIKPGGRPPQSPSPLLRRNPRRKRPAPPRLSSFSAVCWTKRCGSSPARNSTRGSLPHEDAASQKQPFPRLLLGLSCEYPTTSAARIAARRSGWRARGGRSHAPTRRLIDINTGAPRSASMAISEWSPKAGAVPAESLDRGRCSRSGPTYFAPPKQRRIGGMRGERTRRPRPKILEPYWPGGASHDAGRSSASRSVAACRLSAPP